MVSEPKHRKTLANGLLNISLRLRGAVGPAGVSVEVEQH